MFGVMLLTLLCGIRCPSAPDSVSTWRYDLRTGDHLVYREVFRREIDGRAVYGARGGAAVHRERVAERNEEPRLPR